MADPSFDNAIAILGGTGEQGLGLALRFATAGRPVRIGSRSIERANAAAERVRAASKPANRVRSPKSSLRSTERAMAKIVTKSYSALIKLSMRPRTRRWIPSSNQSR